MTNEENIDVYFDEDEEAETKPQTKKVEAVEDVISDTNDRINTDELVAEILEKTNKLLLRTEKPIITEKKHSFSVSIDIDSFLGYKIKSVNIKRCFIIIAVLSILFFTMSIAAFSFYFDSKRYEHNDIKYRYIKMKGGADINDLQNIESAFKNKDKIHNIRSIVEKYEQFVQRRAELIELEQYSKTEKRNVENKVIQILKDTTINPKK
jgi:hypothetical protein